MEKAKTRKIKKWDEVHGDHEVEVSDNTGGCEPEEVAGASPSISRNPMRSIEDMVEQNDNSFDGVINNVKVEPAAGTLEIVLDDKKSVLEKLKEQRKQMGKRLRKIRKENALSQDDVADALGICTKQYQRYEYGDSAISCEKLSILEESFHFDVRYIVTGKREQIDIDRYVVNMPWKEKRDFFERMARYVLRILYNTEKGE